MNSVDCCRICLLPDMNSEMQPLFQEYPEQNTIIEKIELCGGIKIECRNDLPRKICVQCLLSLNVSYNFRNLCQANDLRLKNVVFVTEKLEIEYELAGDCASLTETPDTNPCMSDLSNDSNEYNANEIKDDGEEKEDKYKSGSQTKKKKRKILNLSLPAKKLGNRSKPKEIQMCELCGNVFSCSSLLVMHMRRHANEKPFTCEICQKKFTCQSEINRHMRIHTGVRPFKCQYCNRTFSDRSQNIKHERTHTNERPFECTTCGKAFAYSNVLKDHMLTHTGEKRFRCEICDKTFSRIHQLKQHIQTIIHRQKEAQVNFYTKEE